MIISENAVLGTILKEPYLIKETDLQVDHFTSVINKNIINAMRKLDENNKGIDLISVISIAGAESVGGANHLSEIQRLSNPKKFEDYTEIVLDKWRENEKLNILNVSAQENWNIDKIQTELGKLESGNVSDQVEMSDLLLESYETPWQVLTEIPGTKTDMKGVDTITGGLQDTDLFIVAARPSMGKTDLMLKMVRGAGLDERIPITFSLEMSAKKLRDRLIAAVAGINRAKLKNPERFLTDKEKARWQPASDIIAKMNIVIFEGAAQSVADMRAKTRKAMSKHPGKKPVIFIDYLQIMRATQEFNGNKNQQVGEITAALKELAKEFVCPVVCLSQLSRGLEQRPDKRPMQSDLRDSGSIEQDADVILFLYRDSYYTKNDDDRAVELIFGKHRNGETGTIYGEYSKETGDFQT